MLLGGYRGETICFSQNETVLFQFNFALRAVLYKKILGTTIKTDRTIELPWNDGLDDLT